MSLYTAPTSEDFLPFAKYNAKSGRWSVKKDGAENEVANPVFIADFDNAKKAWMYFAEGQAPSIIDFPSLDAQVPRPSENHKIGIKFSLFSKASFGGVVQFSSNSNLTCKSFGALYDTYEAERGNNPGKLPVIKFTGSTPEKGKYGTNYMPNFVIEKWVDRPVEFDAVQDKAAPVQAAANTSSEF